MQEWLDEHETADDATDRAQAVLDRIDEGLSKLRRDGCWDDLYSVAEPLTRREAER